MTTTTTTNSRGEARTIGALDTSTATLAELEAVLDRGLDTFIEVGAALLAIHERKLWKPEYSTWAAYCRERWNVSRSHAYRLMDAAATGVSRGRQSEYATAREARAAHAAAAKERANMEQEAADAAEDAASEARWNARTAEEIAADDARTAKMFADDEGNAQTFEEFAADHERTQHATGKRNGAWRFESVSVTHIMADDHLVANCLARVAEAQKLLDVVAAAIEHPAARAKFSPEALEALRGKAANIGTPLYLIAERTAAVVIAA